MNKPQIPEYQELVKKFFKSSDKYLDIPLDCQCDRKLDFACTILKPWSIRSYTTSAIAKIAEIIPFSSIKVLIYKLVGVKIGKGVFISPAVLLDPLFPKLITLEDYCLFGWGSRILVHEFSIKKFRLGRVIIKKGAVIGAFSTIRSGVTIGEESQTCMNSFIYKDVPPHTIIKAPDLIYAVPDQPHDE